jgi:hypothetical protein
VSFEDGVLERPQQQQQQQGDAADAADDTSAFDAQAAAMLALHANLLPGTKRQKSLPLPTLQESPSPTPSTSPQLSNTAGSAAAAAAAARDIPQGPGLGLTEMQLQAVQLQQQLGLMSQQQQQCGDLEMELCNSPATAGSFSGAILGSFEEDHSLADFLAEGPEDLDGFGSGTGCSLAGQELFSGVLGRSGSAASAASAGSGQQQQQQPESPPCGRRDARSFEFSRPHNVFGALCDSSSPAQVGDSLLQR